MNYGIRRRHLLGGTIFQQGPVFEPDGGGGGSMADLIGQVREASENARRLRDEVGRDARQAIDTARDVSSRLTAIEQTMARVERSGLGGVGGGSIDPRQADAISRAVRESDGFKMMAERKAKNAVVPIQARDIMAPIRQTITTIPAGGGGYIAPADRVPGISSNPERRVFLMSLFEQMEANGSAVELLRESGYTNNAQAQANEGDTKGASELEQEVQSIRIATYAHTVKASKQALDDQSALLPYIDRRLRWGLLTKTEAAVVSADGTGGTIKGLTHADNHTAAAVEVADAIDTLRYAQEQIEESEGVASAFVMHPKSWADLETTKQGTQDYVIGSPRGGGGGRTLWSLPVFTTKSVAYGNFFCFDASAIVWALRQDAVLEAGYVNDGFLRNIVDFRMEWRAALLVPQPDLVVYGALSGS